MLAFKLQPKLMLRSASLAELLEHPGGLWLLTLRLRAALALQTLQRTQAAGTSTCRHLPFRKLLDMDTDSTWTAPLTLGVSEFPSADHLCVVPCLR